jgi:hypothetical protein
MYGVGLMMWEVWKRQTPFRDIVAAPEPRTLQQFIRYLSDEKNQLHLDFDDGLGIPQVNSWNDGIQKCQNLSITAADLLSLLSTCKNKRNDYKYAQVHVPDQQSTSV